MDKIMKKIDWRLKITFYDFIKRAFLIMAGMLVLTTSAYAHRVSVFAWVEGDTVYVQSKFSGGRKVKDGLIRVADARGKELLRGEPTPRGSFPSRFPGAPNCISSCRPAWATGPSGFCR